MLSRLFNLSTALVLSPLLVLLVDYISCPAILETSTTSKGVSINELVARQTSPLGTYKGHQVYISIDSIGNDGYLSYVHDSPNALVISLFKSSDSSKVRDGALARAVLGKLQQVSPDEGRRLRVLFDQAGSRSAGSFLAGRLDMSPDQYRRFPIQHVFILLLEEGQSTMQGEIISKGIAKILQEAEQKYISALIIPCLGYNWADKNSIKFDKCFDPVFKSLSGACYPRYVYFSLYSDWPTFTLEEAVSTLNSNWANRVEDSFSRIPLPHRGELRTPLILLSLCLWVCSRYVRLTIKNFLILSVSFVGLAVGSGPPIDFLFLGYGSTLRFIARTIVLFVLAVGLPAFVNWNPRDIFTKNRS
jgi:hypothetical protein